MTSEDDFHKLLDAEPDDWQTRLVFADWLDEHGDPRGPGIRALGSYQRKAMACQIQGGPLRFILGTVEISPKVHFDNWTGCLLSADWFEVVPLSTQCDNKHDKWRYYVTRREAEDAAAVGFLLLPPPRQAELLTGQVQLLPQKKKRNTKPRAKPKQTPQAKEKKSTKPRAKRNPKS